MFHEIKVMVELALLHTLGFGHFDRRWPHETDNEARHQEQPKTDAGDGAYPLHGPTGMRNSFYCPQLDDSLQSDYRYTTVRTMQEQQEKYSFSR